MPRRSCTTPASVAKQKLVNNVAAVGTVVAQSQPRSATSRRERRSRCRCRTARSSLPDVRGLKDADAKVKLNRRAGRTSTTARPSTRATRRRTARSRTRTRRPASRYPQSTQVTLVIYKYVKPSADVHRRPATAPPALRRPTGLADRLATTGPRPAGLHVAEVRIGRSTLGRGSTTTACSPLRPSGRAVRRTRAAVRPDEVAHDRQAEAGAAALARARGLYAVEAVEDPLALVGGDAAAVVGDQQRDRAACWSVTFDADDRPRCRAKRTALSMRLIATRRRPSASPSTMRRHRAASSRVTGTRADRVPGDHVGDQLVDSATGSAAQQLAAGLVQAGQREQVRSPAGRAGRRRPARRRRASRGRVSGPTRWATSSCTRSDASGERSSCAASPTNVRCRLVAESMRSSIAFSVTASRWISSCAVGTRQPLIGQARCGDVGGAVAQRRDRTQASGRPRRRWPAPSAAPRAGRR